MNKMEMKFVPRMDKAEAILREKSATKQRAAVLGILGPFLERAALKVPELKEQGEEIERLLEQAPHHHSDAAHRARYV